MLAFNCLVVVGALTAAGLVWTANDTLSATRRVVIHDAPAADPSGLAGSSVDDITGQPTTTIDLSGSVKAENYLLVGSDSRACIDPNSPYAGAFLTEGNDIGDRSDTIMLLRVDPNESQAAILSFPRDLWVKIGDIEPQEPDQLRLRQGRPEPARPDHRAELRRPIDHYIEVDFCAFKYLVDAVGGVKIPFAYPTRDRFTGLDIPAPGCYSMSGDAALAYVRSRHYQYEENGQLEGGRLERPGPHPAASRTSSSGCCGRRSTAGPRGPTWPRS